MLNASRLQGLISGPDSLTFLGNRLTQQTTVNGLSSLTSYGYDDANRMTSMNGVPYTWDANGNLLSDGTNTYAYDAANRLSTVTGPSSAVSYAYNGQGDRLSQTAGGTTTDYTLDLNAGLTQVLDDGTNTYLYGNGRIAQLGAVADAKYFLGDALGSVRQLTDAAGVVTYTVGYGPYGVTLQAFGSGSTSYGFAGEYTDSSGLLYLRARYYQPSIGRFFQQDPWSGNPYSPLSFNPYEYAYDNPARFTDPSGQCVFAAVDTLLCVAIGAVAGGVVGGTVGAIVAHAYAGFMWDLAESGECNCSDTTHILATPRDQFVNQVTKQGAIFGAVLGAIAGAGPAGGIVASLIGIGFSTYGILDAASKLSNNINDKCAWLEFGMSLLGLTLSGVGFASSYRAGNVTGQWWGWPRLQPSSPSANTTSQSSSTTAIVRYDQNFATQQMRGWSGYPVGQGPIRVTPAGQGVLPTQVNPYDLIGATTSDINRLVPSNGIRTTAHNGIEPLWRWTDQNGWVWEIRYHNYNPVQAVRYPTGPSAFGDTIRLGLLYADPVNVNATNAGLGGQYLDPYGCMYVGMDGNIHMLQTDMPHIPAWGNTWRPPGWPTIWP